MKKNKTKWLIIVCLAMVFFLTGSFSNKKAWAEDKEKPKYGGSMSLGVTWDVKTPELHQANVPLKYILSFTYERLETGDWAKGPAGTNEFPFFHYVYVPEEYRKGGLAESWEMPDPQTIIVHVRKGVHFQNTPPVNGREMVADDVVFSFNQFKNSKMTSGAIHKYISSVKALDKYTVEFKADRVHCQILDILGTALIHPHEIVEKFGDFSDYKNACGTGPFIMSDFVGGSSVTFKRNPNYWGHDEMNPKNQLPYIDEIEVIRIPDLSTRLAALRTGKIDYLPNVEAEDAKSLIKTNPELKYKADLNYLMLKVAIRLDKKPFDDIRVRKALSMAINREAIIKDYLDGDGIVLNWPFMANWEGLYTPLEELPAETREAYEYHPEKAKKLMAEAGYPDGFNTNMIIQSAYIDQMVLFQNYWAKIGINCEIKPLEYGRWVSLTYGKKYDEMSAGRAGATQAYQALEWRTSKAFYNTGMFSDAEFDKKFEEIVTTMNVTERNKKMKALNVYYLGKVPDIVFPTGKMYNFWHAWVGNYHGETAVGSLNYGGVAARIYLKDELRGK